MQFRDKSIDDLFKNNDYEEVLFLLVWGHIPSAEEKARLRKSLAKEMTQVPQSAKDAVKALPYAVPQPPRLRLSSHVSDAQTGETRPWGR